MKKPSVAGLADNDCYRASCDKPWPCGHLSKAEFSRMAQLRALGRRSFNKGVCQLCDVSFESRLAWTRFCGQKCQRDWSDYRRYFLVRGFEFTLKDYKRMLEDQDGKCAICSQKPSKGRRLCVDHDHKTGIIRGLLCAGCNRGLGLLKEKTIQATAYLKKTLSREVILEISKERDRQDARWGEQNHPDGTGHPEARAAVVAARDACNTAAQRGEVTWRHILNEEVAEAFAESNPHKIREELIQVAAVAVAWTEAIDRRMVAAHSHRP